MRISGIRKQPWSLRQPLASSTGTAALRLRQFVDIGQSVKLVTTLKETKECRRPPDILTYNSAMELFGKHALEDEAWALIDDLKVLGVSPDIECSSSYYRCVRHIPSPWDVSKILISTHRLSVTPLMKRLGQCLK